jgi:hypothetical protein
MFYHVFLHYENWEKDLGMSMRNFSIEWMKRVDFEYGEVEESFYNSPN